MYRFRLLCALQYFRRFGILFVNEHHVGHPVWEKPCCPKLGLYSGRRYLSHIFNTARRRFPFGHTQIDQYLHPDGRGPKIAGSVLSAFARGLWTRRHWSLRAIYLRRHNNDHCWLLKKKFRVSDCPRASGETKMSLMVPPGNRIPVLHAKRPQIIHSFDKGALAFEPIARRPRFYFKI